MRFIYAPNQVNNPRDWLSPGKIKEGQKTIGHCYLNNRLLFLMFVLLFVFREATMFQGEVKVV